MQEKQASISSNGVEVSPATVDAMAQVLKRLDDAEHLVERQAQKLQVYRAQMMQYHNDLRFWKTAHGHDYPARRMVELEKTMAEIEAI